MIKGGKIVYSYIQSLTVENLQNQRSSYKTKNKLAKALPEDTRYKNGFKISSQIDNTLSTNVFNPDIPINYKPYPEVNKILITSNNCETIELINFEFSDPVEFCKKIGIIEEITRSLIELHDARPIIQQFKNFYTYTSCSSVQTHLINVALKDVSNYVSNWDMSMSIMIKLVDDLCSLPKITNTSSCWRLLHTGQHVTHLVAGLLCALSYNIYLDSDSDSYFENRPPRYSGNYGNPELSYTVMISNKDWLVRSHNRNIKKPNLYQDYRTIKELENDAECDRILASINPDINEYDVICTSSK